MLGPVAWQLLRCLRQDEVVAGHGEGAWHPHSGFCLHQPQVICKVQYQLCWVSLHTSVTSLLTQVVPSRFPSLAAAPPPGIMGCTCKLLDCEGCTVKEKIEQECEGAA